MIARSVSLMPHPGDRAVAAIALTAEVSVNREQGLMVNFELRGALDSILCTESTSPPQRRDELWRHTCFEVFVQRGAGPGYLEFNFSPSGDWAAYEFQDYRTGRMDYDTPSMAVTRTLSEDDQLMLRAQAQLKPQAAKLVWHLNVAAVIEARDGTLSYWAVRHSGPKPDFHESAAFCIALASHDTATFS